MNKVCLSMIILVATSSCTMRQKIMDASLVSMTHTHIPEGSYLNAADPIESRFCPSGEDRGNVGLFDQAIKNAQASHHVDYISNATFWSENNCIILQGTGQKLISKGNMVPNLQKN